MIEHRNELKGLFTQYWDYLAVYAACKQNIFDCIQNTAVSINSLADNEGFDLEVLKELVSVLKQQKLIHADGETLKLTIKGELLTESHPYSLKYACLNWGAEHLTAWQNLDYTLKSGKQAFNHLYGKPFFEYISNDKEKLLSYHRAMYEYARDDYENIYQVHDFSKHHSIIDVGGGLGALINTIKAHNPQVNSYLFDKPEVIDLYKGDIPVIGGDFFQSIPKVADVVIMSRVLHDWSDDKSTLILNNAFESLPKGGVLYLVENLTDKIDDGAAILSLNMHALTGGFERSLPEYKKLIKSTGFKYIESKKVNDLQSLIIAEK
ncbi:methyltransferase [Carboxylicivirga sp. M1479]|uniref:methyltransferase n=1 Tax=Carboxylicivirga sp. M1479 TaxID=2594476 RepID=UPI0011785F3A|nr:methyltransferase [Carboxylicivirga sp. M1479]TRX70693.1 methyltransferase [Carboxylicivirga sp. M1479]